MLSWSDCRTTHSSSKTLVSYSVPIYNKKNPRKDLRTRSYRNKRKFNKPITNQSRIPFYFNVVNKIELILKENENLKKSMENLNKDINKESSLNTPDNSTEILKLLMKSSENNCRKDKSQGYRYDEVLKLFAVYMYMFSGRSGYETLQSNIALPSISSVTKYLKTNGPNISEGELRSVQLKTYLDQFQIKHIWLSEDATRIINRVQYNSLNNELIGFVLPLNDNGMPIKSVYKARSAREIEDHFNKEPPVSSQVSYSQSNMSLIFIFEKKYSFCQFFLLIFFLNIFDFYK